MNRFEAEMAVSLSRFLLLQGYEPGDITIVCPCESLVFCLLKKVVCASETRGPEVFFVLLLKERWELCQ